MRNRKFIFGLMLCASAFLTVAAVSADNTLVFNPDAYTVKSVTVNNKTVTFRSYENIVYVSNPVDPKFQQMNIYVPVEYFEGKSVGAYNAETAPIFLPNRVGGYMPGPQAVPGKDDHNPVETPNAQFAALADGLVVAAPAVRGRTLKDASGQNTGKAPAFIVDLKAAVRYLHFNDKVMPGDAEKIISDGTSAGGNLSALIGATGNNKDYEPYLKAIGAAEARDDIFAAQVYCPVTNMENQDSAYEWMFNSVHDFNGRDGTSTLTPAELDASNKLKANFTVYLNSLKLKSKSGTPLNLDADGNGSFKEYTKSFVIASAQKALNNGTDLSSLDWLTIKEKTVTGIDFDGKYVTWVGRVKKVPAYDGFDLSRDENDEFGTALVNALHFTAFSAKNDTVAGKTADAQIIKVMNPMNYIGDEQTTTAKYWRIRHGARDGMIAIPLILATTLENKGYSVDFALAWGQGHGGDYDLDELFAWINAISVKKN